MSHDAAAEPRIFVGHGKTDAAKAKWLATVLGDRGLDPWLPDWEIGPGDIEVVKLEAGMALADVFLVLMSEAVLDEGWMAQQYVAMLSAAIERPGTLAIPVRVGGLAKERLPKFLGTRRSVDVDDVDAITEAVTKHRGRPPVACEQAGRPDSVSTEELRKYLEKAEELHRELPLVGFESAVRVTLTLDDLYVPLDAVLDYGVAGRSVYSSAYEAGEHEVGKHEGDPGSAREHRFQLPLADAFVEARARGKRGLVLLGDPGSGKTTHLRQVLLKVAREGPESLGLPQGTVPVLLPLRNLRDLDAGLAGFIEQELRNPLLDTAGNFGQRMCERGRLLFLLDGLDEVASTAERAEVSRWIGKARAGGTDSFFLVTSRYAGYTREVELDPHFVELHLRPLQAEQVHTFVRNWYGIVERATSRDPKQAKQRAERAAEDLLETLAEPEFTAVARVYEMTRNPLLLTAICLVHRDRGRLPRARAQLYQESLLVLLERWRESKDLPVTLHASEALEVLQPVARWMHEEDGRTRATATELREPIEWALAELREANLSAEEFLTAIRDESGLLTGWDVDSFGFMHLGFQEYLTALQLRNLGSKHPEVMQQLAARFDQSWWREVILLMLALSNPSVFEELMGAVVQQPAFERWAGSEMMQRCLSEAARVSPAPFVALVRGDGRSWVQRAWQRLRGGGRAELRARQVAALGVLGRAMPEALVGLEGMLERHPAPEVRGWWERWQRRGQVGGERRVDPTSRVELVWIPGGRFLMGSPETEDGRHPYEGPQHPVELDGFWLGKAPVTNAQYGAYMRAKGGVKEPEYWGDPSYNQPQQPVVGVSWEEAQAYCEWAGFMLPTEAQWEYACRAGTTTRYHSGDGEEDLARVGWYEENSGGRLHTVGELEPSGFGLYDMHGNIYEWCQDRWVGNYEGAVHQPGDGLRTQPVGDSSRVVRGGYFGFEPRSARSAFRYGYVLAFRNIGVGFRVAQSHS